MANKKQLKINTEDNHFVTKQNCDHLKGEFDNKLHILEKVLKHGTQTERFVEATVIDKEVRELEQDVFDLDSAFAVGAVVTETVNVLKKFADELKADRVPPVTIAYSMGKHQPRFKSETFTPTLFAIDRAEKHKIRISKCYPTFTNICTNHYGVLLLCDNCSGKQCGHLCQYDGCNKQSLKMAQPFGITILDNQTIAITLPSKKNIVLMSRCLIIQETKEIQTEYTPKSIVALTDGTVALSWADPPAFSISDIRGSIVKNKVYFTQDSEGRTFRSFDYMAVDVKRHQIIQLCTEDEATYCFDFAGKPVFKYTNGMKTPRGAAVDARSGCVFVCDRNSDCIHQLTCDGDPVTIIKHDTLIRPLAICFDKKRSRLWVSSGCGGHFDKIKCYFRKE